jgi:ABC-type transporter Mla subunit MlaD
VEEMASADYSVGTKVTADVSNFEKGMNKAEKSLKGFSDKLANSIDRLGKKGLIGSMANVTLAVGGLTKSFNTVIKFAKDVGKAINECTEAYKGQVIAERALDTAIQNNPFISGASSKALKEFASDMQRVTNYGDEQLIPMMTNLVSLGRTESETMQIMSVAMDMSAGMGISLDSAITQLNATLNGSIGRLGQQNAELKGLTEEELKQGKAIEILGEKFKGLSSATADTSKQLQNIKGDFKEALGQFTLPSSDMWNKFWAGFYEQGIKVLGDINKKINELTIGKTLAGAMTGQLGNLSYTGDRIEYLRDAFAMISDEELDAVTDYLSSLSRVNDEQKQILERAELEKQRRIDIQKIERQMAEESAKRKKEKEEEAELENGIALLKDKHIQKLKEQEAKWENIKKVTGEDVKLEEKIKFYQDDLVAIMTEAGGQITTNNQYYKDQIKLINKLKSQLGEVVEETEEVVETVEEANFSDFFDDLSKGITVVIANVKNGLYDVEAEMQKAKDNIVNDVANSISKAFGDMFTMLGKNLVGAGYGFEDFASVALKALSEVLKSISAQLSAIAVLKFVTHDYANATIALAGATASMVASGVASQVSKSLTTTREKIDAIGESANKAGKDLVYFKKRLEEITTGITTSSRNLVASVSNLRQEWIDAKEKANEAYEAYRKSADADPKGIQTTKTYKLQKAYKELQETVDNYFESYKNASKSVLNQLKEEVTESESLVQSYKDIYSSILKYQVAQLRWNLMTPKQRKSDKLDYDLRSAFGGDVTKTLYGQLEEYRNYINILLNEQKLSVQKLLTDVYDQLSNTGKNIGDKLVNSIINGAEKKDFLKEMKSYIRENLIKIAVYTESFQDKLAEVGMKLSASLTGAFSLSAVRNEIEDLYDTATKNAENAEKVIADVFGDIGDTVETSLTNLEQLMKSFNDSIKDVGGEIGQTFVDSIADGMSQGDFLDKMKSWIKRMLVQSVVYTESMKSEIEAIGQAITKGIREGFTETSLHEIRRDLSWVFNEANKTVASLDDILDRTFSGYATGTNNALSGLHLVGEAGPELVRFRGGEQVINAGNTQKALEGMGGTTINQNVTFNNLQDTTAYAMMNQFKQYNRQMAINGVI